MYKKLYGITGFEILSEDKDLSLEIKVIEKQILSYYTDDFTFAINTRIGPDAIVEIKTSEQKITVKQMSGFSQHTPTSKLYSFAQWKLLLLQDVYEKIKSEYGEEPWKEARSAISFIKAIATKKGVPKLHINNLSKELSKIKPPLGRELIIEFSGEVNRYNLFYSGVRGAFEKTGLPPIITKGITINGVFPLTRNTVVVEDYLEISLEDGVIMYMSLIPVYSDEGNKYLLRLTDLVKNPKGKNHGTI